MRLSAFFTSLCFVVILAGCDRPEEPPPPQMPEAPGAPKSTAEKAPTALDQPRTEADTKIVQKIRQAVVEDKALSTSAQNVTIVSEDGVVTLHGKVKDQTEKELLAARAQLVDGVKRVDNQLVIAQ